MGNSMKGNGLEMRSKSLREAQAMSPGIGGANLVNESFNGIRPAQLDLDPSFCGIL